MLDRWKDCGTVMTGYGTDSFSSSSWMLSVDMQPNLLLATY